MIHLFQRFRRLISLPLQHNFNFFITILILHALVDVVYFYIYWRFSLNVFLHGLFIAYVFTLPCLLLAKSKPLLRSYKLFILLPYVVSFLGDILAHAILDSSLDEDVAATILATNKEEFIECVETYFSFTPIIIGIGVLFITYKIYHILNKVPFKYDLVWLIGILFGAVVTFTGNPTHLGGVIGKGIIFSRAQLPVDLDLFESTPELAINAERQPQNIVMIVGESLTKLHCSTYGYDKLTTPKLQALADSSLLYTFTEVKSPEVHTLPVFKTLFSQYRCEWGDSVNWYTQPTLQQILHRSGYTTHWISNQSKHGVCDNFIGKYAELCTDYHFVGNKLAGMKRKTFDGEVIDLMKPLLQLNVDKNFYVVHLMGSHFKFDKRYPKSFDHFQADDYPALPSQQQKVVATYDNSVLYNDSVVSEVMRLFADKEAIVFYFSDHAIDLFQSSDHYYGHAKKTKESFAWGQQIPFFIYMTRSYQQKYPQILHAVKERLDRPFCTDNMFYTVMDLAGICFTGNNDVQKYSLFNE